MGKIKKKKNFITFIPHLNGDLQEKINIQILSFSLKDFLLPRLGLFYPSAVYFPWWELSCEEGGAP